MMHDLSVEQPGQSPSVPLTPNAVRAPALFRGANVADAAATRATARTAMIRADLIAEAARIGLAMETLADLDYIAACVTC